MNKPELTPRQAEIFAYIRDWILGKGHPPTVREIGNQFGISSPNGVVCHLKALDRKGYIIRDPDHHSRAITLADHDTEAAAYWMARWAANGWDVLIKSKESVENETPSISCDL
jgi:repressor LexA